ncbi:MAG: hypothetical protein M5R36_26685 [Deltaproteobacteria bacterium]|nr:hypothetical protein [Deltaproteobacteria bacterium]
MPMYVPKRAGVSRERLARKKFAARRGAGGYQDATVFRRALDRSETAAAAVKRRMNKDLRLIERLLTRRGRRAGLSELSAIRRSGDGWIAQWFYDASLKTMGEDEPIPISDDDTDDGSETGETGITGVGGGVGIKLQFGGKGITEATPGVIIFGEGTYHFEPVYPWEKNQLPQDGGGIGGGTSTQTPPGTIGVGEISVGDDLF